MPVSSAALTPHSSLCCAKHEPLAQPLPCTGLPSHICGIAGVAPGKKWQQTCCTRALARGMLCAQPRRSHAWVHLLWAQHATSTNKHTLSNRTPNFAPLALNECSLGWPARQTPRAGWSDALLPSWLSWLPTLVLPLKQLAKAGSPGAAPSGADHPHVIMRAVAQGDSAGPHPAACCIAGPAGSW